MEFFSYIKKVVKTQRNSDFTKKIAKIIFLGKNRENSAILTTLIPWEKLRKFFVWEKSSNPNGFALFTLFAC